MPLGGVNTNCVIAGHRGWSNGKYLKDIEEISVGDVLKLTTLWDVLSYRVTEIRVIAPNDLAPVAEASTEAAREYGETPHTGTEPVSGGRVSVGAGVEFESSKSLIFGDEFLHDIGFALLILIPLVWGITTLRSKKRTRRQHNDRRM